MTETSSRNPATQKQAKTWLTPEQVEWIGNACLTDVFPTYLQGRNETVVMLLEDTGLRVSELVVLDWVHVEIDVVPSELFLPDGLHKDAKQDAYLDLENETVRQLLRYRNDAWRTTKAVFASQ